MKPINPKPTLILAKPSSLIVRVFLISLALLMSHGVFAQTYLLGDTGPGGGKVFYVDGTGEHGFEAQARDYNNGDEGLHWGNAKTAAASYTNSPDLDCSDPLKNPMCWHLPTKTELNLLYQQRNIVGGFATDYYWSSTEYDSGGAWGQYFTNGKQYLNNKNYRLGVRAVRAF